MFNLIRPAISVLALMTLLTGVAYPLLVTAVAQTLFPVQANGSLVYDRQGRVQGSLLLAQAFDGPQWFQPRPSAGAYATLASSASNLAPSNPQLVARIEEETRHWQQGPRGAVVPMALVTTSGSGLDPHLPVAAARFQIERVAAQRGIAVAYLQQLVDRHIERSPIGPAVVNVLALNRALADNRRANP